VSPILCQFCGAANAAGRERCRRCGSVLLVVSGPPEPVPEFTEEALVEAQEELEEHLFERITTLEESVRQLARALGAAAERLEELEHRLTVTHSGVESLGDLLEEHGVIPRAELQSGWEERLGRELLSQGLARRFLERSRRILSQAEQAGAATPGFRRRLRALELALLAHEGERALEEAEALAREAPGLDELWSFVGEMAFELGDSAAAREAFARVLELRGPHYETLIYLGTALTELGEWDAARRALEAARRQRPESFLPAFTLGALELGRGRPEAALPWLDEAVGLEEIAQTRYLLGVCELQLGRPGRAIRELGRAVELDPEFEDALYQLGLAYLRRGWRRKALAAFREVLALDPQRLEYRETVRLLAAAPAGQLPAEAAETVRRAEALLERGRDRAALAVLLAAARAHPGEPGLAATAALLASALGESGVAVRLGHAALRSPAAAGSPYLAAAAVAVLEGLRRARRPRAARRAARSLLERADDPLVRGLVAYELALLESELGDDLDAARELALVALEETPRELRHYPLGALGGIALKRGSVREAVRYLEQATDTAPVPALLRQLAVARLEAGDAEGAARALDEADEGRGQGLDSELLGHVRRLSLLLAAVPSRAARQRGPRGG